MVVVRIVDNEHRIECIRISRYLYIITHTQTNTNSDVLLRDEALRADRGLGLRGLEHDGTYGTRYGDLLFL